MPQARFVELFRDFVCGCMLRVGRELFAFLPIQTMAGTAVADLLDPRTGHRAVEPIVSVRLQRTAFEKLNFDCLDPAEAMENFPHRMAFKNSTGFDAVERLAAQEAMEVINTSSRRRPQDPVTSPPAPSRFQAAQWSQIMAEKTFENGSVLLAVRELAPLLNISEAERLSISDSRSLGYALDNFGFCIEPDARQTGAAYWWHQEAAVFKRTGKIAPASAAYVGAAALLQLCTLIAAADGHVSSEELNVFREFVGGQLTFNADDRARLLVLERLLVRDPSIAGKSLSKITKGVPEDKRLLIGQVLVRVAAIDNVITKDEYRALERIFKAFTLPSETLRTLVRNLSYDLGEVTVQDASPGGQGEKIPNKRPDKQEFAIDMDKVASISKETIEVIRILSGVMNEEAETEPEEKAAVLALVVHPASPTLNQSEVSPDITGDSRGWMHGLDEQCRPILERLITRQTWSRTEFQSLASEFNLMPLSAFDSINEWADEALGDFLLEGEDPVQIRTGLIAANNK
jgi:uncharacterized tellurite resistance protein B-like protein